MSAIGFIDVGHFSRPRRSPVSLVWPSSRRVDNGFNAISAARWLPCCATKPASGGALPGLAPPRKAHAAANVGLLASPAISSAAQVSHVGYVQTAARVSASIGSTSIRYAAT
ncbi:hypothetical protein A4G30_12860 [Mycobacterium kansasii]|uniref:Uncharacterized protein n=1 Tax=Mycobacterium kansasii ATCC 12478 TaxID=557599 RepID=U5WYN2_MYCKA|nr:hypothetical protein MKAN_13745 [Mycobacterium kansasii ATCC 12478]KZS72837.1 hypothetical protein A4G30_12860 [Mycobacterium kansasii]